MIVRYALGVVLAAALAVPIAAQQEQQQLPEHPKVPKDSVFILITGCLKGRVIHANDVRQDDTTTGPIVRGKTFRLAGKKPQMQAVKENDGNQVQVTGLVKKSDLGDNGVRMFGGRVAVGGGTNGTVPTTAVPDPAEGELVMDVQDVHPTGTTCGGDK